QFDFLIHKGQENINGNLKEEEYKKLVKYFLASLTIPDKDQWVNLSPYEKSRVIENNFGRTEMGRDLLAEDYVLKQITSSLMYPEDGLGKLFWNKVYERAWNEFHQTGVPVNTFNKVWIVPDKAVVYESGDTVYILQSHLKVMLEEDYLAMSKNPMLTRGHVPFLRDVSPSTLPSEVALNMKASQGNHRLPNKDISALGSKVIREVILPELEREVNEGKNFARLRQIYSAMILAVWFKKALKQSLLGQIYADKAKVKGVLHDNPEANEVIYQNYLKAFKKGVYNYIKDDYDRYAQQTIPRRYFSGGFVINDAMLTILGPKSISNNAMLFSSVEGQVAAGYIDQAKVDLVTQHEDTRRVTKSRGLAIHMLLLIASFGLALNLNPSGMLKAEKKFNQDTLAGQVSLVMEHGQPQNAPTVLQKGQYIRELALLRERVQTSRQEANRKLQEVNKYPLEVLRITTGQKKALIHAVERLNRIGKRIMNLVDARLDPEPSLALRQLQEMDKLQRDYANADHAFLVIFHQYISPVSPEPDFIDIHDTVMSPADYNVRGINCLVIRAVREHERRWNSPDFLAAEFKEYYHGALYSVRDFVAALKGKGMAIPEPARGENIAKYYVRQLNSRVLTMRILWQFFPELVLTKEEQDIKGRWDTLSLKERKRFNRGILERALAGLCPQKPKPGIFTIGHMAQRISDVTSGHLDGQQTVWGLVAKGVFEQVSDGQIRLNPDFYQKEGDIRWVTTEKYFKPVRRLLERCQAVYVVGEKGTNGEHVKKSSHWEHGAVDYHLVGVPDKEQQIESLRELSEEKAWRGLGSEPLVMQRIYGTVVKGPNSQIKPDHVHADQDGYWNLDGYREKGSHLPFYFISDCENSFYPVVFSWTARVLSWRGLHGHGKRVNRVMSSYGGIDFTASQFDLQIKRDRYGVPLPFRFQDLARLKSIDGFVPVLINIITIKTLPFLA
ncbi:MAG: hypothetical protein HQL13_03185, partial [Candidatus Omnitrophica bacterium]|nr:hypothetical protein [Candidatus Omnitrophota bacterium]